VFDVRECAQRLNGCENLRSAGEVVLDVLRAAVPEINCNVFPLVAGSNPEVDAVCFHADHDEQRMRKLCMGFFSVSERDLGSPWAPIPQGKSTYDLVACLGCAQLQKAQVFNELWRPYRLEHQVLALLGESNNPGGFICVTRERLTDTFATGEIEIIDSVRALLEQTYYRIHCKTLAWLPVALRLLEPEIRSACAIFDSSGKLLWLSEAAWEILAQPGVKLAGVRILTESSAQLEEWRNAALGLPSRSLLASSRSALEVRSLPLGQAERLILVRAGRTEEMALRHLQDRGLSRREAQVALQIARGLTTEGAALELGVSIETLRTHLKST
jgi:hypothetical protein